MRACPLHSIRIHVRGEPITGDLDCSHFVFLACLVSVLQ